MQKKKKELLIEVDKPAKNLAPEEQVRQRVIADLRQLGWPEAQLRWKPEWPVPDTPHDLTKRERGQKYATCGSADLVAFADQSGEWHALQVIFEFKAPDIDKGRAQLLRYTSLATARIEFSQYLLSSGDHHFFVAGAEPEELE